MRYTFPANYGQNCILLPLDTSLIPLIAGALRFFETRVAWATDEDYQAGYNAIAELKKCMASNNCVQALIDGQDRLYRLLDTALNGTQYNVQILLPDGQPTINPPIPDVPPQSTTNPNAMRAHLGRLWQLSENMTRGATFAAGAGIQNSGELDDERGIRETVRDAQGLLNAGWFGIGGQPATLADVVRALRVGSDADQGVINNALAELLAAGSNTASIINTVRGLFDTAADTITEGGTLAVLVAGQIAQAAIAGAQAAQLDALQQQLVTIAGRLVDPNQNLSVTQWLVANTAAAQAIRGYLTQGIDPTTQQSLLQGIYQQLIALNTGGGEGGTPATVQLDAGQLAELVNLLECICEATNGPPTMPAAPQFDPEVCGEGWNLLATWRPTAAGTNLTGANGTWETAGGGGPSLSVDIGPNGENVLKFDPSGQPYDCRVWFAYADGYTGAGTGNLEPFRVDELPGGPGRPTIFLNDDRACQQFLAYGVGTSTQPIGYAVSFGVGETDEPLSADNFAVFVTFSSFG